MAFPYSAGDVLTAADLNASSGLVLIKQQTIGSGVSSVTVTDAFSSTFRDYVVKVSGCVSSTPASIRLKFGSAITAYYSSMFDVSSTGTQSTSNSNNGGDAYVGLIDQFTHSMTLNIYMPALATRTMFDSIGHGFSRSFTAGGHQSSTVAHTSFILNPASGTFTGGSIRVYGYNNG